MYTTSKLEHDLTIDQVVSVNDSMTMSAPTPE